MTRAARKQYINMARCEMCIHWDYSDESREVFCSKTGKQLAPTPQHLISAVYVPKKCSFKRDETYIRLLALEGSDAELMKITPPPEHYASFVEYSAAKLRGEA